MSDNGKCLIPGCGQLVIAPGQSKHGCRGLCKSCYQAALRRIKMQQTTWEELESLGFAIPLVDSRGKSSPFWDAVKEAREKVLGDNTTSTDENGG